MQIIALIIFGLASGWLTGRIMEGSGFGVFVDMIVGLCGAVLGGIIFSHLGSGGLNEHGLIASIVVATIGAVILTLLFRSLTAAPNQPEG